MEEPALIYDAHCPMCRWYSGQFVKHGLVPEQGRISFEELADTAYGSQIDRERARHEIPLVDRNGGATRYGLDSLLTLLRPRLGRLTDVATCPLINPALRALYALVSYNRRVISGHGAGDPGTDLAPRFHLAYRLAYVVLAVLLASAITAWLADTWSALLPGRVIFAAIASGWVAFLLTGTTLLRRNTELFWDFLAHQGTVMLIGVGLLLPGLLIGLFTPAGAWITAGLVPLSFGTMLLQQRKRTALLELRRVWIGAWIAALLGGVTLTLTLWL